MSTMVITFDDAPVVKLALRKGYWQHVIASARAALPSSVSPSLLPLALVRIGAGLLDCYSFQAFST